MVNQLPTDLLTQIKVISLSNIQTSYYSYNERVDYIHLYTDGSGLQELLGHEVRILDLILEFSDSSAISHMCSISFPKKYFENCTRWWAPNRDR